MRVHKQDSCLMFTIRVLMAVIFTFQLMNIKKSLTPGHKVENNESCIINILQCIGSTKSSHRSENQILSLPYKNKTLSTKMGFLSVLTVHSRNDERDKLK
jgi:hypothetical protein